MSLNLGGPVKRNCKSSFAKRLRKVLLSLSILFSITSLIGCESMGPILEGFQKAVDEQCRSDSNCKSF